MWLGERHPFGFPFIVAFHAGADLGIVLIVSAMDLGWARAGAFVATLCCRRVVVVARVVAGSSSVAPRDAVSSPPRA